ncbi:MAG: LysR substrate-binding domain-containing protein, partial [candidate division NC10 bacterium]
MSVTIDKLRYFAVLAEELNFTRAASRVFMTQQAFSVHIRQLEVWVGTPLFERAPRGVELTPAGAQLIGPVREALETLDAGLEELRALGGVHRPLRIGGTPFGGGELITAVLDLFRAEHPDIVLEMWETRLEDPTSGLHGGLVDLAFVRPPIDLEGLVVRELFSEPIVLCVSSQHPLAEASAVTLEQAVAEPLVIAGGPAAVNPAPMAEFIDAFVIGEGEEAILELANALEAKKDFRHIRNLWFRSNGTVIKNNVRPLIENLDALPFPDRSIFKYQAIIDRNYDDGAEFMVGRGCPFHCSFCINKALQDLYKDKGRFVRYRSVNNVIAEIKSVTEEYSNIGRITFQDDILGLNTAWLAEFARNYGREIHLPFRCNLRADNVDDERLRLLQKAGCAEIWVGVE